MYVLANLIIDACLIRQKSLSNVLGGLSFSSMENGRELKNGVRALERRAHDMVEIGHIKVHKGPSNRYKAATVCERSERGHRVDFPIS